MTADVPSDIFEVIARRHSVRDYLPDQVGVVSLAAIQRAGHISEALTGTDMEFHLIAKGETLEDEVRGILGDYGKVIRGPHYIVLSTREANHYLLDGGYRFEQMVLEATRRNLGTCWVGGFFREETLRTALGLGPERRIIALTPVGLARQEKRFISRVVSRVVRSKKRKPISDLFSWEAVGQPLPTEVEKAQLQLLEAARWAPSWANKQPWRFVLTPTEILLYKQSRQMKEDKDYTLVDCGIVMAHLHLAAKALGRGGAWYLDVDEIPGARRPVEPIGRYSFG
jgi:nitroreductase